MGPDSGPVWEKGFRLQTKGCPVSDAELYLCGWCQKPFAPADDAGKVWCSEGCEEMWHAKHTWYCQDGRAHLLAWYELEAIPRLVNPKPEELPGRPAICVECGRPFRPNFGPGLPGKGRPRIRCYECSPSQYAGMTRSPGQAPRQMPGGNAS